MSELTGYSLFCHSRVLLSGIYNQNLFWIPDKHVLVKTRIRPGMTSFLCLFSTGSAALGADGGRCKTIDNLSIAFTFFTLVLFNSYFSCEDIIFCFCYLPEPFFYQERMMLDSVIPIVPDELIVIIFFLF